MDIFYSIFQLFVLTLPVLLVGFVALALLTFIKRALFGKGTARSPRRSKVRRPKWSYSKRGLQQRWANYASDVNKVRDRDPIRFFREAGLSSYIYERAENRCEHFGVVRCKETKNLQLDHIYPWYHGGWTILGNAQVLCQHHNQEKGAEIPSASEIHAIALKRIDIFPTVNRELGEHHVRWTPDEEERNHRAQWLETHTAHVPPMPLGYEG